MEMEAELPLCAPHTATHFNVERQIHANGIFADIRHFGWTCNSEAIYQPDSYYLDFSIGPRNPSARLFDSKKRPIDPPGDVVFLPKGGSFASATEPGEHSLLCLTFENDRAMQLFEDESLSKLDPCFDVQLGRVRQGLARLLEELRNPGFGQDIFLESAALLLVVELCRHFRQAQDDSHGGNGRMPDWRLRRIKDRVEAELSGTLSVADLAADIRTSARHLIRTFKATTGVTLTDYIASRRIARAQEQLVREDMLIKVIAGNCGFQSAAAFSAAFRKATGMTPREFREERVNL